MEVYLDILIIENFAMNYIILYTTSLLIKTKHKVIRFVIGSAIGAFYAVISLMFVNQPKTFLIMLGKVCLSLLIVAVAFYPKKIREFFKTLVTFYMVTFIFAGAAFALILYGGAGGIGPDGSMYLNWNFPINFLVLTVMTGMFLFGRFRKYIRERSRSEDCFVSLYIVFDGNGIWIPALVDTGNELKDPMSGYPVIIVEASAIDSLFPKTLKDYFSTKGIYEFMGIDMPLLEAGWLGKFRIVPYSSLGCAKGMLPGFKPDYIEIDEKGQERILRML